MEEKEHAKYSPSSRYRWSKCSASVDVHVSTPNEHTEEGTRAHEVFEWSVKFHHDHNPYYKGEKYDLEVRELQNIRDKINRGKYPKEMIDYGYNAYDLILEKLDIYERTITALKVEHLLGDVNSENFGTADLVIDWNVSWDKGNTDIYRAIVDYKYGFNPVNVADNGQLLNYACLDYSYNATPADMYVLAIYQPRAGGFSFVHYNPEDIEEEYAKLRREVTAPKTFKAGGHCTFCSHKPDCQEYQRTNKELVLSVFNTNDNTPKEELPLELCAEIITKKKQLNDFISYCENKVFSALINHQPVTGWKLIQGSGNRKWSDEEVAAQRLASIGVTPYEQKVVSPTSVEKTSKEVYSQIEDLVVRPEGKLRLVPESHKGKAIESPLAVFDFNKG